MLSTVLQRLRCSPLPGVLAALLMASAPAMLPAAINRGTTSSRTPMRLISAIMLLFWLRSMPFVVPMSKGCGETNSGPRFAQCPKLLFTNAPLLLRVAVLPPGPTYDQIHQSSR